LERKINTEYKEERKKGRKKKERTKEGRKDKVMRAYKELYFTSLDKHFNLILFRVNLK
jgi:hypothetical protein